MAAQAMRPSDSYQFTSLVNLAAGPTGIAQRAANILRQRPANVDYHQRQWREMLEGIDQVRDAARARAPTRQTADLSRRNDVDAAEERREKLEMRPGSGFRMRTLRQKRNGNGLDARLELGARMKTKVMLQKLGVVAGLRGCKRILRYFQRDRVKSQQEKEIEND